MTATLDPATTRQIQDKSLEAARITLSKAHTLAFSTLPPDPQNRIAVWSKPVSHTGTRAPLVWLLGAHGGAGVSSLARSLAPAADCHRMWPAVLHGESPFVVLVARETIGGLTAAHDALRQYHCGQAGPGRVILLGLITVAHQPGRVPAPIRRYLGVISDLLPKDGRWRIGWQPAWPLTPLDELPEWNPADSVPDKGRDPLAGVRDVGEQLLTTISALLAQPAVSSSPADATGEPS